jgi:hypothetical protein
MNRFLIVFLLITNTLLAQSKNNSYSKLCLENEKGEVLLVQYKGIWELAGKGFESPRTIHEHVRFMAQEMGTTVDSIRLRGLFTLYHNAGPNPVLFHYYSARYAGGTLTVPPGCTDIRWVSRKEALAIIPFKVMTLILSKMWEKESTLWGGSLHVVNGATFPENEVKIKEPFYKLN